MGTGAFTMLLTNASREDSFMLFGSLSVYASLKPRCCYASLYMTLLVFPFSFRFVVCTPKRVVASLVDLKLFVCAQCCVVVTCFGCQHVPTVSCLAHEILGSLLQLLNGQLHVHMCR